MWNLTAENFDWLKERYLEVMEHNESLQDQVALRDEEIKELREQLIAANKGNETTSRKKEAWKEQYLKMAEKYDTFKFEASVLRGDNKGLVELNNTLHKKLDELADKSQAHEDDVLYWKGEVSQLKQDERVQRLAKEAFKHDAEYWKKQWLSAEQQLHIMAEVMTTRGKKETSSHANRPQ
jgi:hypothetical protein